MRIVVFGLGYLGATHAACMAELGHEVLGIELDDFRREELARGEVPFYEPGLPDLVRKHLESGLLRVSASYEEAAEWGGVYFIAVGTPQRKGEYAADLRYVDSVVEGLVPLLTRDALILGKSTVPVGTCERLANRAQDLAKDDVTVHLGWNPEFLREGHAIDDTLRPDRIVVGAERGSELEGAAREVYARMIEAGTPYIVMDRQSAEMVKVAANSFLATKISFINAIAEVCEAAGADVTAVADAIGHDDRIGRKFLNAGLGFGGGCLPKDIRAFMARAGELGASEALSFLREVDNVNMRRRNRMVNLTKRSCGGSLLGKRVAVLGAAFKPESDDVRDSPALNVAGQLQLQGASVVVYDPKANNNSKRLFPTLDYAASARDACQDADVVAVLTEWKEFRSLKPVDLNPIVRGRTIIDGRLCLEKSVWEAAGWSFLC
ncbi:UDP-glucose dehydrogenase family protein [Gordonia terrae]|uniref:UDP-glucose 6-dehydrogenase n=2 Tax=Gordonia terrae TaxID=2055 RepID=A0AAD0NUU0_9ACTN|nr:UDP-glucose/GDP-mannose dehydrogenase family protein [Gordonia terrae]VTR06757.1 nucleotide sugar dehydrogenase [Clostridioides difficile]ANY22473.1 UDP-glucose 6-dehydrogenase [Gordonia terrae]AWO83211.1 UDP-glucose/GDP-mannose dehydrogenase family protein [Gordonia terrae]VTS35260.1 UDP-glucose 6-dehydrogenase ywqF [Gordonia terrae]GAB45832.1 UDP-glucose 6-dehydrogenase [Gordonia terrae NBRC 100016]